VSGVSVKLEGCVLPQDNEGRDSTAVIDANGMAGFYCHPMVVQYCYGSAAQLCSWTATKGSEVYLDDIQVGGPGSTAGLSCCCMLLHPEDGAALCAR
jgi:hypothetical protein